MNNNRAVLLSERIKTPGFWKPIIVSLIVTPLALFAGGASAGGGHGDFVWVKVLFPYTLLQAFVFQSVIVGLLLAIIQFPVYGIILAFAGRGRIFGLAGLILTAMHVLAAVLCFVFLDTQ